MKKFLCLKLFIFTTLTASSYAEVELIRYKGLLEILNTKKESLNKDENKKYAAPLYIKTGAKSFAKFKVNEKLLLIFGPNSEATIPTSFPDIPPMVNLIKGKLRGSVNKVNSEKPKVLLKTRSASIGIRGTEFLVLYNQENNITTNITFKGEVDFYKNSDEKIIKNMQEEFDQVEITSKLADYYEILDDLSSSNKQKVSAGTLSGAYPTYDFALKPVKISPKQLKLLKDNAEIQHDASTKKIYLGKVQNEIKLSNKNLIPDPLERGIKSNKLVARSGGVVDLNTGIYVMPPLGSAYNQATDTYELPSNYGSLNAKSGEYVPPDGVVVDSTRGFMREVDGKLTPIDEFSKEVKELFEKYKKLTRVDLYTDARYYYSYKSFENYYGEYRNITTAESMTFDFAGSIGRHLFNNKRYLHYIKGSIQGVYHNRRDEPLVQRNDRFVINGIYEFHRKYTLLNREARFIVEGKYETIYQDHRNLNQWDFYTDNLGVGLFHQMKTSRRHQFKIGGRYAAFSGHVDEDHGTLIDGVFENSITTNTPFSFDANFYFKLRNDNLNSDAFTIYTSQLAMIVQNILRKTDLRLSAVWEYSNSEKNIKIDEAKRQSYKAQLERRKGEYLKFHAFYEFLSHNAIAVTEDRDFINQIWGIGLRFIF